MAATSVDINDALRLTNVAAMGATVIDVALFCDGYGRVQRRYTAIGKSRQPGLPMTVAPASM